jgi:hypothetical protein
MEKEWIADESERTCPVCSKLDGTKVKLNDKFVYKGQEFDGPPQHVQCRCTLAFSRVEKH